MTKEELFANAKEISEHCKAHSFCAGCDFKEEEKSFDCKLQFTPNVWNVKEEECKRYKHGKLELIDVLKDLLPELDGYEGFCVGNAIKYLWRFKYKGGTEDLEKAKYYINKMKEYGENAQ